MEFHRSAFKHGISAADIAHAIAHARLLSSLDDYPPWRLLYLGPDRSGNFLEVVTIERDDGIELVIHAMRMRKVYERVLSHGGSGT